MFPRAREILTGHPGSGPTSDRTRGSLRLSGTVQPPSWWEDPTDHKMAAAWQSMLAQGLDSVPTFSCVLAVLNP